MTSELASDQESEVSFHTVRNYSRRITYEHWTFQLKNMIKINCAKYMVNLKGFTEEYYPSLTDGINVYSSIQMFVVQYAN